MRVGIMTETTYFPLVQYMPGKRCNAIYPNSAFVASTSCINKYTTHLRGSWEVIERKIEKERELSVCHFPAEYCESFGE